MKDNDTQIIFICGTGGVGKTTTSALFGIQQALQGKKTMLITIDPARRLADSLHISLQGNEISQVPLPETGAGSLSAMMLDAAAIFTQISREYSSSADFQALKENRYFQFARDKMGGIQEYMAIIEMMRLYHSKKYDIIIIDTPPARNAIEFLEAPERLQHLFSSKGLHWLSSASGFGAFSLGRSIVAKGLQRFLGSNIITDMTEFFSLFKRVAQKLERSSQECVAQMHASNTHFWIVTTPSQQHLVELQAFISYLQQSDFQIAGLLINKYPKIIPPLSTQQKELLQKEVSLQQKIDLIQQKQEKEIHWAEQQLKSLNLSVPTYQRIPKSQLESLEDMIQVVKQL